MSLPVTPTAHTHHNTNGAPQAAWQAVAASSIVAAVVGVVAHRGHNLMSRDSCRACGMGVGIAIGSGNQYHKGWIASTCGVGHTKPWR